MTDPAQSKLKTRLRELAKFLIAAVITVILVMLLWRFPRGPDTALWVLCEEEYRYARSAFDTASVDLMRFGSGRG